MHPRIKLELLKLHEDTRNARLCKIFLSGYLGGLTLLCVFFLACDMNKIKVLYTGIFGIMMLFLLLLIRNVFLPTLLKRVLSQENQNN